MTSESRILDYSCLSEIRTYWPLVGPDDPSLQEAIAGESYTCRHCRDPRAPLKVVDDVFETAWSEPAAILTCDRCGWWCQYAIGFNRDGFYERERVPAALRTYAVGDIEVPVNALRRELAENPKWLAELNHTKMEHLVGSILRDYMKCDVVHTGRTGDGGVDLLLLDGETPYVVQVKRRLNEERGEAVSAIREFVGATLLAGYKRGIYVTTATHFTPPAEDAAVLAKTCGLVEEIHLVDQSRFLDILHLVSNKTLPPWKAYYRDKEGVDIEEEGLLYVRFHGEGSPGKWIEYDEAGNAIVNLTSK